jgi:hypothetical protein
MNQSQMLRKRAAALSNCRKHFPRSSVQVKHGALGSAKHDQNQTRVVHFNVFNESFT